MTHVSTSMTEHDVLIAKLVERGYSTKKFEQVLKKIMGSDHRPSRVLPDAFHVDDVNRVVTVYECEVTFRVNEQNMEKYGLLWFRLDCESWELKVVRVSTIGECEIDASEYYFKTLIDQ